MATANPKIGMKRKGSNGSGWIKQKQYLQKASNRKSKNKDISEQLKCKMDSWYSLCKTPAALITYFDGGIKVYGNNTSMRTFCDDAEVQESFIRHLRIDEENQPELADEITNTFDLPENWADKNVHCKREIIRNIMSVCSGGRISWVGVPPSWWPNSVLFENPTGKVKMASSDCSKVIQHFVESNVAFMVDENDNFCDDEANNFVSGRDLTDLPKRLIDEDFPEKVCVEAMNSLTELNHLKEVLDSMTLKLDKLQSFAFNERTSKEEDVELWQRSGNSLASYEPIVTGADGNCLYRSVCKSMFGDDKHWAFIKLGGIVSALDNLDDMFQNDQNCKELVGRLGFSFGTIPDCDDESIKKALRDDIHCCARNSSPGGAFQIYCLSRFCRCAINLVIHKQLPNYEHVGGMYQYHTDSWGYINILGTSLTSKMNGINHFLSLLSCETIPGVKECWADTFCKVLMANALEICNFCKLPYHRICLSQLKAVNDSCGCHLLNEVPNQINWLAENGIILKQFDMSQKKILNAIELKLSGQRSCGRLKAFRHYLMGDTKTLDFMNRWFQSIHFVTVNSIKQRLQNAIKHTAIKALVDKIAITEKAVDAFYINYLIPEALIVIIHEKTQLPTLTIERFTFGRDSKLTV